MPISSRPVDTKPHLLFFSSLTPIMDCWDEMEVEIRKGLDDTIHSCTRQDTRERRKALYRHDNPAGNLFSLCFGLSEPTRLLFVVQFIEFLCIIDDVLEDLPHEEAQKEHDILCEALRAPKDAALTNVTPNTHMEWIIFLRDLKARMLTVDPVRSPALLVIFEKSLRARDSSAVEFDTIEKYIPYRLINFDYEFVSQLILWAMDIDLASEEGGSELLAEHKYSIGVIVGLVNDYFSWEREKRQQQDSDRIRNGVAVLMKQHSLSDADAKANIKTMIVGEEAKIRAIPRSEMTEGMKRYLDGLEMFAGGYSFWCATCPRYSKPQGDN
ncbi:hypothetical protein V5O48_006529 [Marasmius crinis-equi]|uniref:Terpenoid synthase n=1 Tax=Marasmius crinis-equi TaxID=585013 RepID=A0ABR3FJ81_9AGAR